jgi:hypothetical protein
MFDSLPDHIKPYLYIWAAVMIVMKFTIPEDVKKEGFTLATLFFFFVISVDTSIYATDVSYKVVAILGICFSSIGIGLWAWYRWIKMRSSNAQPTRIEMTEYTRLSTAEQNPNNASINDVTQN